MQLYAFEQWSPLYKTKKMLLQTNIAIFGCLFQYNRMLSLKMQFIISIALISKLLTNVQGLVSSKSFAAL